MKGLHQSQASLPPREESLPLPAFPQAPAVVADVRGQLDQLAHLGVNVLFLLLL